MAEALLRTTRLSKTYRSGDSLVRAVADLSVRIEQGEFVAIQGRSGSGKSTVMHLLGLLDRPDAGEYLFLGKPVEGLSDDMRAAIRNRDIGFVFQQPALLPRATAIDNVALPLAYAGLRSTDRRRRAANALDRVGLAHRTEHWPQQLSGGEQQRVGPHQEACTQPGNSA